MRKKLARIFIIMLLVAMLAALTACTINSSSKNPFQKEENGNWIQSVSRDSAIDDATLSIQNLKKHLNKESVAETGYYTQFDMDFDSSDGSHFTLKLKANLHTFPYYRTDENGNVIKDENGKPIVDPEKEKIHNEIIKTNDLIVEWYDGHTNKLLIGLYFDGKNTSMSNPGNNLYLNLRGETKRMFKDFGDTVMYRQLIRLITSIDINKMLGGDQFDQSLGILRQYLKMAITDNYKVTENGDTTSTFFNQVNLDIIADSNQDGNSITDIVQGIFAPFGNKIDPLTEYYLGFKFSTPGSARIRTFTTDLRVLSVKDGEEPLMTGLELAANGTALVKNEIVSFETDAAFSYEPRIQADLRVTSFIDVSEFSEYKNGQYEYQGELYVPMMEQQNMESRMDAIVRTKLTSDVNKNDENRIQMSFTDKANGSRLLLGAYYCNERTYLNTTGLQDLYGGIKINEIGFPQAYIDGPNIAQLLTEFYDTINDIITDYVDGVVEGSGSSVLFDEIMAKMTSGEETISIRVDLELIKIILRETQEGNPEYSTQDIIDMLSEQIGYDLEEIAFMLGIPDAKRMLEKTWFDLTYNVVTSAITVKMSTNAMNENLTSVIFQLDLLPLKIGRDVTFPEGFDSWFDDYKELKEVKTISASMSGTVKFANGAAVDISDLLGAMIGDKSGLNTRYFLPSSSSLGFSLVFDQYVKFDNYDGDVYPGDDWENQIGAMRGRIGFKLQVWEEKPQGGTIPILNVYAKDVAFNTNCEEDKLGYVWVDIQATKFTKVRIREDVFLASLTDYMGGNSAAGEAMALSIPQIIAALLEDSNEINFLPDVIQFATSNKTIQKLFGVKAVHLDASVDVGLTPRVAGIAQLEGDFANYTVGTLADMTGEDGSSAGVYEKNLHDTIAVTFTKDDGHSFVEYLRVPYYRVPAPGAISDYDSQEDYDAAVAKYKEYLASMHSLEVIDGKSMYYPSTDGNFMGQFRSYTVEIRRSGGASLTSVTSKVLELAETDLVWEPLEEKPSKILGTIKNGSVNVPADFSLDWSSVTLDGLAKAQYTVVIGPGSIGEATFTVFITVRNRRIVKEDGSQSDSATVYQAVGDAKSVPVAAEISIDPYDYILWRGEYVLSNGGEPENPIGLYLKSRTDLKTVVLQFGDGQRERVTLDWAFDAEGSGGLNHERYITAEGGNALYAHTYFHNQLIALRVKVMKKEFDYLMFDGETEEGVYTVDVLNTASKTIPVRPTVYFKDGTSRKFPFDLVWAFPVADNVTLNGSGLVDGVESPFIGNVGNTDAAWLSIRQIYGESVSWFKDVLMTVTVKAPAKSIENVYQVEKEGKTHYAKDVMADGGELRGYWVVDGLKPQSKYLPASLTAYFVGAEGSRSERHYGADVIRFDDNGQGILSPKQDGKYLITERSGVHVNEVRTYVVTGWISEEFSFDFIIAVLPQFASENDSVVFFDQDGKEFDQSVIVKDALDASIYKYTLNPFESLFLPNQFEIRSSIGNRCVVLTSADGNIKENHYFRYDLSPEIREGNYQLQYQYVIRGEYTFSAYLKLEPTYRLSDIEKILLNDGIEISKQQIADGFRFEQFELDAEGYVLDNEGDRIVIGGAYIKLADYIRYLFTGVQAVMGVDKTLNVTPNIIGFDKFDVQSTLSETGATYFVAFSEIPNLMNIQISIKSQGIEGILGGNDPSLSISPFTADGKEVYPDGYQLYAQEFIIRYIDKSVSFRSGRWTVAQTTNLKGNLLPVGTEISVISAEILRAERESASEELVILLYAFLEDSSRINLTVRVAPLDIETFVSAENELFPIRVVKEGGRSYSAVEVNNLYEMRRYLVDAASFLSYLPTTVKIGGTELRDVMWIADAELEENLRNLTYRNAFVPSGITEFKLSTAEVKIGSGENPYVITLDLYVRFYPAILDSVRPDGVYGDVSGVYFESMHQVDGIDTVTLRVKPYATPDGTNSFAFPATYTARFFGSSEQYTFPLRMLYDGKEFGDALYFDYNGTTFRNFVGGDTKNKMTFTLDAGFGQQVRVILEFVDQTVEELSSGTSDLAFGKLVGGSYDVDLVETASDKVSANFVVDPYGVKYKMSNGTSVYIPTYLKINYVKAGGSSSNVTVQWSEYTVRFGGQPQTILTGVIARQGFTTQTIKIKYSVKDRSAVQENVFFRDEELGNGDVVVSTRGVGMPTAHIKNPFTFRVANDLPKTVGNVKFNDGNEINEIPIYWEMKDTDVDYNGNNMTAKAVRYRLYDENGQQFTFYLQIDRWEYVSLEREVSGNWQEMNPIYFQISAVSGESDITTFRIQFRVTDATGENGTFNGSQIFYSETSKEVTSDKREPVLYFDKDAIALAKANGSEVQGTFSLGGEGKLKYEVQKSMAVVRYASAQPSITDTYFYYKVLTTDYYSPYVLIDPLNPVLPTELYAYVNWTKDLVKLEISEEGDPFGVDHLKYLNRGGGVIIGRSVYVVYHDPTTGGEIRFKHKIDLLFLDRSVSAPVATVAADAAPPTTAAVAFCDNYNNTTYAGRVNPYSDSYGKAMDSINVALRIYGASADVTDIVWDTELKTSVSFKVNGTTYGSADTPCTILRYETAPKI